MLSLGANLLNDREESWSPYTFLFPLLIYLHIVAAILDYIHFACNSTVVKLLSAFPKIRVLQTQDNTESVAARTEPCSCA